MSAFTPFWARPDFDKGKPMLIYGYGLLCLLHLPALISEGINIVAIFDRNPKYHGQTINGIPILSPERINDFPKDLNVFISPCYWAFQLTEMFRGLGFNKIFWNYEPEVAAIYSRLERREEYAAIIAENEDKIKRARSLFKEEKSLEIFDAVFDAYGNGNYERLGATASRTTIAERGLLDFGDDEVYADVGAYTGDTAFGFARTLKYKYKHIYSFEPAEVEFKIAERLFEYEQLERAEIHRFAVCDKVGSVSFTNDNSTMGAKISDKGAVTVPSTTLDAFFLGEEKRFLPTYIHMDVEGAEIEALEGSRELIAKHLPKLSISVYHRIEHYWEAPLKIEETAPGKYEFFMRHYGNCCETMCLTQPKK